MAICSGVNRSYVVDFNFNVFVLVTVDSPLMNTMALSAVNGEDERSKSNFIPVIDPVTVVNEVQWRNISVILVTLLVSKLDKSNVVKPSQSQNIRFISVTLLVSKLDRSNVVNDEHL